MKGCFLSDYYFYFRNKKMSMQNCELETKRLILRPLRMDDADQTQRLFPYWDVVKFLNAKIPWPYPPDAEQCGI
jgi:hypothetical protein